MRKTFGVIDPLTKEYYKDIIKSFIEDSILTQKDLDSLFIKDHIISTDNKVIRKIKQEKRAHCIISFQDRKDVGKIAIVRLYEKSRRKTS